MYQKATMTIILRKFVKVKMTGNWDGEQYENTRHIQFRQLVYLLIIARSIFTGLVNQPTKAIFIFCVVSSSAGRNRLLLSIQELNFQRAYYSRHANHKIIRFQDRIMGQLQNSLYINCLEKYTTNFPMCDEVSVHKRSIVTLPPITMTKKTREALHLSSWDV